MVPGQDQWSPTGLTRYIGLAEGQALIFSSNNGAESVKRLMDELFTGEPTTKCLSDLS